ncbi:MAG: hypothetical protein R6V18_06905 [Desulfuromonadaceae bacterium]
MSVFVVAGAVAVLMLVYMISALGVLPWFLYIPFVLLFALVFFWDKIRAILPGSKNATGRCVSRGRFNYKHTHPKCAGRGNNKGKHSGKRI